MVDSNFQSFIHIVQGFNKQKAQRTLVHFLTFKTFHIKKLNHFRLKKRVVKFFDLVVDKSTQQRFIKSNILILCYFFKRCTERILFCNIGVNAIYIQSFFLHILQFFSKDKNKPFSRRKKVNFF